MSAITSKLETDNKKRFEWRNWFVYIVLIAIIAVFGILSDRFFQIENFAIIGSQTAMVSLIAFGATFVITTGNIDLSLGSIIGLVGVIAAFALKSGFGIFFASLIGISAGCLIGLINGLITAKLRIPAFLVTLGTKGIARGLALTITETKAVVIVDKNFTEFWSAGNIFGIPMSIFWTLLIFALCIILYHYTAFGNYIRAVGGNKIAARYSGVKVDKVTILVFIITGFLAAVAGLLMAARLKNGRPEVGDGMELDAITAVVLGGASVSGGQGKIVNTLIGSILIGVIINGLIILGVQTNVQQIIKGIIIIAAVSLSKKQ